MSGGSYNYNYSTIEQYYVGKMYDEELNKMMKDLVDVLHDLEWWTSDDTSEEEYRETVNKFKSKWFKRSDIEIHKYIDSAFEEKKNELLKELNYLNYKEMSK